MKTLSANITIKYESDLPGGWLVTIDEMDVVYFDMHLNDALDLAVSELREKFEKSIVERFDEMCTEALDNWMFEDDEEAERGLSYIRQVMGTSHLDINSIAAHIENEEDWDGLGELARFFGKETGNE